MLQTVREDGFLDLALMLPFRRREGRRLITCCVMVLPPWRFVPDAVDKEGAGKWRPGSRPRVHRIGVLSGQKALRSICILTSIEMRKPVVFPVKNH